VPPEHRDRLPAGVYLIDDATRDRIKRGDLIPPDSFVAVLDGEIAANRIAFFAEIARVMQFPAYFGHNWDAVYDCLTDLNWLPAAGYVLLLDGFGPFAAAQPEQWAIGLRVLRDACAFWQPLRTPMTALLCGPAEQAPGVPRFPGASASR
jgi:hypothetical protein